MNLLFGNKGEEFLDILYRINKYCINSKFPSLKNTIDKFNFDDVYDEILNYIDSIEDLLEEFDKFIYSYNFSEKTHKTEILYRIKAEDSLLGKWNKNIDKKRPLRKVCNDIIGIRVITNLSREDMINSIFQLCNGNKYNKLEIINFYENPKKPDDGYRGVHVYFKENSKSFPIEIQFWTRIDALLNFYTHEVIYKTNSSKELAEYSLLLRKWLYDLPSISSEIKMTFIDYLYEIVFPSIGGN